MPRKPKFQVYQPYFGTPECDDPRKEIVPIDSITRDVEPPDGPPMELPNAEKVPQVPDPPKDLGPVSALPNLIPVVAAAEP